MSKRVFFLVFLIGFGCTQNEAIQPISIEKEPTSSEFKMPPIPDKIKFAGQAIEIDNFDLKERLDKELVVNTFYHSSTIQSFKRANRYFDNIEQLLEENDVPADFKYLCLIESGLTQAVSPSGAKGFWQFMPMTAKEYGLIINDEIDERLHIEKSTKAACQYLLDANKEFNDWLLTAASYNRGVGGIKNDMEEQYVNEYFDLHLNNETSRYVFRILALKLIFENPEDYGFEPKNMELYEPVQTKSINVERSITDLAKWAKKYGTTYHLVKVLNPWIKSNKLSYKGQAFIIEVPK